MNLLIIDTTRSVPYIVLKSNNSVQIKCFEQDKKVSENLIIEIDNLLYNSNIELKDINYLACATGPGSFTGIRIGMSTTKAFEVIHGMKLISVNGFEPFLEFNDNFICALPCTKSSLYYAEVKNNCIKNIDVCDNLEFENKYNLPVYSIKNESVNVDINKLTLIDNYIELMIKVVEKKISLGEFVNNENLIPLYIQVSQAEKNIGDKQ